MNNSTPLPAAVRAFRHIWSETASRLEIGADLDALVDAGEWSGPANARTYERLHDECLARVAARFGISPATLENAVGAADCREQDCFYAALRFTVSRIEG